MKKQPIEFALDRDLRLSLAALQRAALRARKLAAQTGTAIIVSQQGVIKRIFPAAKETKYSVQEESTPYGDEE